MYLNISCWTPVLTDSLARTATLLPFLSCQWWIKRRAEGWVTHIKGAAYPRGLIPSQEPWNIAFLGMQSTGTVTVIAPCFPPLTLFCIGLKGSWSGEWKVNQSTVLHCMSYTHQRLICCLVKLLSCFLLWMALKLCPSNLLPLKLPFFGLIDSSLNHWASNLLKGGFCPIKSHEDKSQVKENVTWETSNSYHFKL